MSSFWESRRVLVTGGNGFLGQYLCRALYKREAHVYAPTRQMRNLFNLDDITTMIFDFQPEVIIHAAAVTGGIEANRERSGEFFNMNALMGIHMINAAYRNWAIRPKTVFKRFVTIGTVCEYPENTPIPLQEDFLWDGYPEPSSAAYAMSKKMLLVQAEAYKQQFGFDSVHILLTNLYGAGDNFDLRSGKVVAGVVRKCVEAVKAGSKVVNLWGIGSTTRDLLHASDAAEGILLAVEYGENRPVNIASGVGTSLRKLADTVAEYSGFAGQFVWDATKPVGMKHRYCDISRARAFGFSPKVDLDTGIAETVAWYEECV